MSSAQLCREEYLQRLEQRRAAAQRQAEQHIVFGRARTATFCAALLIAWLAWQKSLFSAWWLVLPLLCFIALLFAHDRLIRKMEQAKRMVAFYEQGLRRIEDRWAGTGVRGERFASAEHPYAGDLDIFGRGSLFELLCTARTRMGEATLAAWLSAPASPATIYARQAAVADLRDRLDFREKLATAGEEVRSSLQPQLLTEWGAEPTECISARVWAGVVCMAAVNLVAAAWGLSGRGYYLLMLLVVVDWGLLWRQRQGIRKVALTTDRPAQQLDLLSALLSQLETEPFRAPLLQEMQARLTVEGLRASVQIARLQRLLGWLNLRQHVLFAPVDAVLLWTVQLAFAVQNWRAANGAHLADWITVLGDFEALGSLAAYACEHPADPFPEIVETGTVLRATGLAHPLLPQSQAVPNDIAIEEKTRCYIISGSNMSGKSTLMRTIGVNTVLALAGAPVRAVQFTLTPVQIGASLRTQDSLQGGISRFYAEIQRLRQIVDLARERPTLLFLLDEILHGTNSHDRRLGAEAVLRSLLREGSVGLLTTHDLSLTQIAADPELHAINVHFEDSIEDGKMHFDYHLRPGVVTRSNAIELMRAVGLEV